MSAGNVDGPSEGGGGVKPIDMLKADVSDITP
ncbi:hypothetical protein PSAC2689_70343 [Paraburkholderia sacchari]